MKTLNNLIKKITIFESGSECYEFYKSIDTMEEQEILVKSFQEGYRNKNFRIKYRGMVKTYIPK